MTDEQSTTIAPPYISFRTFLNLIDRLASAGIPQHIDRHYWKGFLSGSLGPQVMTALRFFQFITGTDNVPTSELEHLVKDTENRKQKVAEMLHSFYAPVFNDNDLSRATTGDLDRTFTKHYKLSADTRRKSIAFFLHAVQYAEIPLSSYLKEASRTKSTVTRGTSRPTQKKAHQNGASREDGQPKEASRTERSNDTQHSAPPNGTSSGSVKTITLRKGESLTLSYSGDMFHIDKKDRELVNRLIDAMDSHEQEIPDEGLYGDSGEQ